MQWQTQLPETILLTTWAHVNKTSGKITNIRKFAFLLLCILCQISIVFYLSPTRICSLQVWLDPQQFLMLIKGKREGSPQLWELFSQNCDHHLPYLAQHHSKQAGVSWEEDEMDGVQCPPLNLTSIWFYCKWIHEKWVELTPQCMSTWGQNSLSILARVWVSVKMNSQVILVALKCTNMGKKVHQFVFCFH